MLCSALLDIGHFNVISQSAYVVFDEGSRYTCSTHVKQYYAQYYKRFLIFMNLLMSNLAYHCLFIFWVGSVDCIAIEKW